MVLRQQKDMLIVSQRKQTCTHQRPLNEVKGSVGLVGTKCGNGYIRLSPQIMVLQR
ncbi:Uncharacterised protein [Acinetobacter baumannii]|nr:Uncharacterised protein [Acinetobacter baumannii]